MNWFLQGMLDAAGEILKSPFKDSSIWWLLAPIIVLWFVLEIYFGRYKGESLGWNTSLGNGISLVWINIEGLRFLFSSHPEPFLFRFIPLTLILAYGCFIIYISFTHKLSSRATYILASPTPVYFLSSVSALWSHGVLDLTWFVVIDLIILYLILTCIFTVIRKLLPEVSESEKGRFDVGKSSSEETSGLESELGKEKGLGNLKL